MNLAPLTLHARPAARLGSVHPYAPPASTRPGGESPPVLLKLDANEGPPGGASAKLIHRVLSGDARTLDERVRQYPGSAASREPLERAAADLYGVPSNWVLVSAGGDEALDRICRAYLEPGRIAVTTTPTFEMIPRYIRLSGVEGDQLRQAPWIDGPFPVDRVAELAQHAAEPCVVFVVSPNNPTGGVIEPAELERLRSSLPPASLLVLDLAYEEFASHPLAPLARTLPNTICVRTLSKAWGFAGLRVGFAVAPPELLAPLRAAGNPYSVSALSLVLANAALRDDDARAATKRSADRVRIERAILTDALRGIGSRPISGEGNFVLASMESPQRAWAIADALRQRGILVRRFPEDDPLGAYLRVTCPCDDDGLAVLVSALAQLAEGATQ